MEIFPSTSSVMPRTSYPWILAVVLSCSIYGGISLEVTRPAAGDSFVAGRTHTVMWTGTEEGLFHIDLYYCGSYCSEDYCGDFVSSLCPGEPEGCPDGAGDYDVVFPEPLGGLTSDGYVVLVEDAEDSDSADCSDSFLLVASPDAPGVGDTDGPSLEVLLPLAEDEFEAGGELTLKFIYNDGFGASHGRFSFKLFEADGASGTSDCSSGTPLFELCDKPDAGCRDSAGDYDVMIPSSLETGTYAIEVSLFEDDAVAGCSESFSILGESGEGSFLSSTEASSSSMTPSPSATTFATDETDPSLSSDDDLSEGCSVLNINAMPGLASDYTGTYSSLGSAGGKPRFVRADNEAVLQYAIFDGEGFWLLTGLGTTFSVMSDAEHPSEIECSSSEACWMEDTPTGEVDAVVEVSCALDSTITSGYYYEDNGYYYSNQEEGEETTPSPIASSSEESAPCSEIDLASGGEAFSDYSGIYSELGIAGGRPRFVREDNVAVLQYAEFDDTDFWLLTGLTTTLSVVSDAAHPTEIVCEDEDDCWKEETPSGQVDVGVELECAAE